MNGQTIIYEFIWYDDLNFVHHMEPPWQETARDLKLCYTGNFIKSREIGHHVQGILCRGLANMQYPNRRIMKAVHSIAPTRALI